MSANAANFFNWYAAGQTWASSDAMRSGYREGAPKRAKSPPRLVNAGEVKATSKKPSRFKTDLLDGAHEIVLVYHCPPPGDPSCTIKSKLRGGEIDGVFGAYPRYDWDAIVPVSELVTGSSFKLDLST